MLTDSELFGDAYRRGRPITLRFLRSRGFSEPDAQEIAQAAWARAWERRAQLRDKRKLVSWVVSIALNIARACAGIVRGPSNQRELVDHFEARLFAALDAEKLLSLMYGKDGKFLRLRYLNDWDIEEIAEAYNCSPIAVRIRLHRARKSLRKRMSATAL